MSTTEREALAPKINENDINRWQSLIQQRPEGPWEMGNGGSFDRTVINPISDDMLAELANWLYMGYTPWNGRSMPLSAGDRQFMYMLYFSVQGLIARTRAAEKSLARAEAEKDTLTPAARDVFAERQQQISKELWSLDHDDNEHRHGGLSAAAACYAVFSDSFPNIGQPPPEWPWDAQWWKPSNYRRDLVKAGALILAEIDRLDRAALAAQKGATK